MRLGGPLLVLLLLLPSAARPSEPGPEAVLADLPFAAEEPNRVIVDLAPEDGDRAFPLFLDTGASDSVLTPRLARQLGVGVRRDKSSPYRRPTRLGRDLQFWIDDRSSDTASRTGWEYGLLGGRFLAEYVVEIDFAARRVRFLDRRAYRVPEVATESGEAVLPLRIVANRPLLEIGIEGRRLRVLLDTGAPQTLVISGAAVGKAGLALEPIVTVSGGGVLGPIDMFLAEVRELRIGPFAFGPGVPVLVAPRGLYNQGSSSDSVLGYDVLAQFVVRIDYPRRRLWLRRREGAPLTLFGGEYAAARQSGVLLAGRDPLHAYLVFPGSRAERRGLRSGDAITSVGASEAPDAELVVRAIAEGGGISVRRRVGSAWEQLALVEEPARSPPRVGAGRED